MKSFQVPITIEVDLAEVGSQDDVIASLKQAAIAAAKHRGFTEGTVGLLITDDETIHSINREHLQHDYPTDVISFAYECAGTHIEGELVASLDTARREAKDAQWPPLHELLLYVVHGTLHIGGMDDQDDEDQALMRLAEREVLATLGIQMPALQDDAPNTLRESDSTSVNQP